MGLKFLTLCLGWLALASLASQCSAAVMVNVNATASHSIPSTLYGQMFEDISSGDGGLYGELLQNRAFQQVNLTNQSAALAPWRSVNGTTLAVIADSDPVSSALPNSLQVTFPPNTSGPAGFSNAGYWGINVNASWTYSASLYFRFPSNSSFDGNLTLGLQTDEGEVLAANSTEISGAQSGWQNVSLALRPTSSAPTGNNTFFVAIDSDDVAGAVINFAMFSLFPPTYKGRPNGMRIDIAETLAEMGPAFFRFPGGNNLGQTVATRWQWNATVGPLLDRPGRIGDWGYVNTDGLGLYEYMTFLEDVGMAPIMGVWSGFTIGHTSVAEDELGPYIQQAIDQIEFVIGDPASSAPAAIRASMGHPAPFNLTYVEIGNEDFFGSDTYTYRWRDFAGNLSAAFPQLSYIATSLPFNPILTPTPLQYDVHVYQTPKWFADNAFYYDSFERNGTTYFEGEYAANTDNTGKHLSWPDMQSSTGEAAFMTGLERNSDIVFAAAYAPLLENINSPSPASPDLISFDARSVYRSTSYYVQQLFALNLGDEYLPSTLPTVNGTLYWSVSRSSVSGDVFIKISNTVGTPANMTFALAFGNVAGSGQLQLLQGNETVSNTPETPDNVVPATSTITTGNTFNYTAPGYSVSVITLSTS